MKTALALIAVLCSAQLALAVEYVTMNVADGRPEFGPQTKTLVVAQTSLIEVSSQTANGGVTLEFTMADGTRINVLADHAPGNRWPEGGFIGVMQVRLAAGNPSSRGHLTLKITSASEINAVTPSAVLVLPENSTGNFDVIIESSDDLLTWTPFFSQTVNSATATRFFRTRVTKTPAQNP